MLFQLINGNVYCRFKLFNTMELYRTYTNESGCISNVRIIFSQYCITNVMDLNTAYHCLHKTQNTSYLFVDGIGLPT